MSTKTKPTFKGKALIEVPSVVPQIGYLEGDFGKEFLEEYKGRVDSDYNGNSALNVLRYNGSTVTGSNPFAVVLANQILRQEGLRTATQADLETAMRIGAMDFRGTYEETGLFLRTEEDRDYSRNTPLAKDLGKQLKARGIKFSPKNPVVIPLTDLELQRAENNYGLTFKIRDSTISEEADIYEVPILGEEGKFDSEDINEKTGFPGKLGKGNRYLYTRDSGLSRLYLDNGLSVGSDYWGLVNSDDYGRVVVVSAFGTSPKLAKLQKMRDDEVAKIDKRYQAAVKVFKGK